jgi:hypothetical protein
MLSRKHPITTAPVGSIDLAAEGHVIWPCQRCLPWHLEVLRDPETDETFAREWHAVDCPALVALRASEAMLLSSPSGGVGGSFSG